MSVKVCYSVCFKYYPLKKIYRVYYKNSSQCLVEKLFTCLLYIDQPSDVST